MASITKRSASLVHDLAEDLSRWWRELPTDARAVATLGLVLIGSGVFHVLVWAVAGGAWEGPVSWRKPIVFGLSGGVTSLSLAWVMTHLPATRGRRILGWTYTVAMGVEVALITMQRWRGVASHFNRATVFDGIVFGVMGLCIAIVAVVTVVWTVQVFRRRGLAADRRAVLRIGLVLLLASYAVGQLIVGHGEAALAEDPTADPAVFGAAGLLKVPHGLALHGIQVLPLLSWLLGRSVASASRRARAIRVAGLGYAGLLGFTLVQTLGGRAPLDVGPVSASLGIAGLVLLVTPFVVALGWALVRTPATAIEGGPA